MARFWLVVGFVFGGATLRADDVIHRFEGEVLPYDASVGWIVANRCDETCIESLADGRFRLFWAVPSNGANYHHWIAQPPSPPPTLWVEWRFRSNHLIPRYTFTSDGRFATDFGRIHEVTYLYADAAVSASGNHFVLGLNPDEFHSFRFESLDGLHFTLSVDGEIFKNGIGNVSDNGSHFVQFSGHGGNKLDYVFNTLNEWDFVRYGTIGYGEAIVAVEPPGPASGGFLDARVHAPLDRFTVTFEEANYVYVDEIAIDLLATEPRSHGATKVTAAGTEARRHEGTQFNPNPERERRAHSLALGVLTAPAVTATRRLDNGPPETVEIVLDGAIPYNATTRFTFNDGTIEQTVELTFAPGDTDGDGDADLADFAALQNCFGHPVASARGSDSSPLTAGVCQSLDRDGDSIITAFDFAAFQPLVGSQ